MTVRCCSAQMRPPIRSHSPPPTTHRPTRAWALHALATLATDPDAFTYRTAWMPAASRLDLVLAARHAVTLADTTLAADDTLTIDHRYQHGTESMNAMLGIAGWQHTHDPLGLAPADAHLAVRPLASRPTSIEDGPSMPKDSSPLTEAATAFDAELVVYARLGELFLKTPLTSLKQLERANQLIGEIADCEQRLQDCGKR